MKKIYDYLDKNVKLIHFSIPIIFAFLVMIFIYFINGWEPNTTLFIAAVLGLFMAMSIWANDVANNMGPAVGSKALTIVWAIIIAAIFEASGAIIAWWDVVDTIKWWIIDWSQITETSIFINIMLATLVWACLWIVIATISKAPVSATHSIIWWLLWAGITAMWFGVVHWSKIWEIAASWVISPVMWWLIAVLIIYAIRKTILKQKERWEAAKKWVPFFVSLMWAIFSIYLLQKWLKPLLKSNELLHSVITTNFSICFWIILWIVIFFSLRVYYKRESSFFKNSKSFINKLFNIPLVFAVALLSFAHWANDVANAIWPLAAINDAIFSGKISNSGASIPMWVMLIWGLWLALWLATFWSRLIKTVWWEITKLNQTRAFAIALSAAITVLIASALGLPVSSTHIALGWVFGVGLYRERLKRKKWKEKEYIHKSVIKKIVLAWIVTLPSAWLISSIVFLGFQSFL